MTITAPSLVDQQASTYNSYSATKQVTVAVQAGDIIVVTCNCEGNSASGETWTVADGDSNSYGSPLQLISVSAFNTAAAFAAVAGSNNASLTITATAVNIGTSMWWGLNARVWRGSDGVGVSNKENGTDGGSGTEPSLAMNGITAHSAIVMTNGDWNAVDGASRTYRTADAGSFTETLYFRDAARFTVYGGSYLDVGASGGNLAIGLSAPTGQTYSTIGVEVLGHNDAPVASYVNSGSIAYSTSGGSSVAPGYPASPVSGNKLVLVVGQKPSSANGGTCSTPAGWSAVTNGSRTGAGGYGTTLGADTGNTNVYSFEKTATGSESGTLSVTVGTNNICWAQIHQFSSSTGQWAASNPVTASTGSDTSGGTGVSITMSADPGLDVGDVCLGAMVIPTDVTTPNQFSARAFTAAGATFGTGVEISEPDSSVGNDIGGMMFRAPVTGGPSSAAPVLTATAGGTTTNVRGPGLIVRLRPAAAGTIYNDSVSEGATAADSYSDVPVRVGAVAEAASAASTQSAGAVASGAVSEAGAADSQAQGVASTSQAVVEAASALDGVSGGLAYVKDVSDAGTAASTASEVKHASGTLSETGTVDFSTSAVLAAAGAVTELASAAEAFAAVGIAAALISEAGAAADAVTGTVSGITLADVSETGEAADAVGALRDALAAVVEAGGAGDALASVVVALESFLETATAADALDATSAGVQTGSISEPGSAADALAAARTSSAGISEAGNLADALSATAQAVAQATEVAAADGGFAAVLDAVAAVLDSMAALDAVAGNLARDDAVAEAGEALDAWTSIDLALVNMNIVTRRARVALELARQVSATLALARGARVGKTSRKKTEV